jgi:hypothetical protein
VKFRNLAAVFDTLDTFDGYSGRFLFKSQQGSFETAQPEGSLAKRRVLSVAPGVIMPRRLCVEILGERWVVGAGSVDGLFNRAVRASYWTRKATDLMVVRTPGEAAVAAGGFQAYCMREYFKDTVDGQSTADYFPQYETHFASSEPIARGQFLVQGTRLFRIRSVRDSEAGFLMASADDLGTDARQTATFTTSTYSPETDSSTVASSEVMGVLIERARLYSKLTHADAQYLAGDHTLLVDKLTVTPSPGQEVTVADALWRVEQVTSEQDAWALHIRRR